MRLSPIPLPARPHTVVIAPCVALDAHHAPAFGPDTAFPRVKVQFTASYDGGVDATVKQTGVCYIDGQDAPASPWDMQRDSLAAGHPARLTWQGAAFLIDAVTPVHQPDGTVHHWKVTFR